MAPTVPCPPAPTRAGEGDIAVQHLPRRHPDKELRLHLVLTGTSGPQGQGVLVHPAGIKLRTGTQRHLLGDTELSGVAAGSCPAPCPQPHLCPEHGGSHRVGADGDGVEGVVGLSASQGDIGAAARIAAGHSHLGHTGAWCRVLVQGHHARQVKQSWWKTPGTGLAPGQRHRQLARSCLGSPAPAPRHPHGHGSPRAPHPYLLL